MWGGVFSDNWVISQFSVRSLFLGVWSSQVFSPSFKGELFSLYSLISSQDAVGMLHFSSLYSWRLLKPFFFSPYMRPCWKWVEQSSFPTFGMELHRWSLVIVELNSGNCFDHKGENGLVRLCNYTLPFPLMGLWAGGREGFLSIVPSPPLWEPSEIPRENL